MFTGGNPFDTDENTTVRRALRPRIKFIGTDDMGAAELCVEMVDSEGFAHYVAHRAFIPPGGSITLNDIVVELLIKEK